MILDTIRGRGRHTFKLLVAALREIFDEAAYSRFLKRKRTERSRESYAEFLREHEIATERRPRCC
jgi:hypothetical protein